MRKDLQSLLNKKVVVKEATVERYGLKSEYVGGDSITILMKNIYLISGMKEIYCDHVWMTCGKWFQKENIRIGSKISMNCHVKEYQKGYVNWREFIDERTIDIGIQRASNIKIIESGDGEDFERFLKSKRSAGNFISNKYAT